LSRGFSAIAASFNLRFDQVDDPKGWCRDITNLGKWGNGDVEMSLSEEAQIDYAVGLAEQVLALQVQE
jgi:predicted transport protein